MRQAQIDALYNRVTGGGSVAAGDRQDGRQTAYIKQLERS
jgi:hypothetical protein